MPQSAYPRPRFAATGPAFAGAAGFLLVTALLRAAPSAQGVTDMFRVVPLASGLADPMQIAIAPDGKVLIAERAGQIKVYDPAAKSVFSAGSVPASVTREDGLLGLILDPGFAANRRVFLLWSALGAADTLRLSRFDLSADYRLAAASRKDVLRIPFRRNEHSSGGLAFDAKGNLYLGIGDDSNNLSDGFPPMDETAGRSDFDAQRSSANSNDLRGKILRIHPEEDGSYTIPEGNLFASGTGTRPEIFTMGNRNPFRLTVDPKTGWLYWAEPGPNARADDPARGLRGVEEVNLAKTAGNYGWPYCVGLQRCFRDYDYAARTSGPAYDPAALRNDSPNNTGLRDLPPARPAFIQYSYTQAGDFPIFGSGSVQAALTGPLYRFDPSLASAVKIPRDFDNCLFLLDWGRGYIHYAKLDAEGKQVSVQRFREGASVKGPMDLKLGPDGALYLLTWGNTSYPHSSEGALARLEYTGPQEPIAVKPPERKSAYPAGRMVPGAGRSIRFPGGGRRPDAAGREPGATNP